MAGRQFLFMRPCHRAVWALSQHTYCVPKATVPRDKELKLLVFKTWARNQPSFASAIFCCKAVTEPKFKGTGHKLHLSVGECQKVWVPCSKTATESFLQKTLIRILNKQALSWSREEVLFSRIFFLSSFSSLGQTPLLSEALSGLDPK